MDSAFPTRSRGAFVGSDEKKHGGETKQGGRSLGASRDCPTALVHEENHGGSYGGKNEALRKT